MKDFEKMMDGFLKILTEPRGYKEGDPSWSQLGKLDAEDIGRRKGLFAQADILNAEISVLKNKIHALTAQSEVLSSEWWVHLRKKYGIPMGDVHITDEGKIMFKKDAE